MVVDLKVQHFLKERAISCGKAKTRKDAMPPFDNNGTTRSQRCRPANVSYTRSRSSRVL
jgi:hypothetical protein